MSIAVVGANGYVGQHLCQRLQANGHEVITYSSGTPEGISPQTGLFASGVAFPEGVSAVYFLAQSPFYRQMPDQSAHLLSVNCVAAVQAAEAARKAGIKKFVYASTGNVYAPSVAPMSESHPVRRDNWYSLSKVMAEDALALYAPHMDVAIARIFGAYGPNQPDKLVPMMINNVRQGREVSLDHGPTDSNDQDGLKVSLLYIDDLIDSMIKMLTVDQLGAVNLGGSEAVSIKQLVQTIASILQLEPSLKPSGKARAFDLIADISKANRMLCEPRVGLQEGLSRVLA